MPYRATFLRPGLSYSGLRSGASADEVLARAEADSAPFTDAEPLKAWVVQGLAELS
jgi:hypothetical protein